MSGTVSGSQTYPGAPGVKETWTGSVGFDYPPSPSGGAVGVFGYHVTPSATSNYSVQGTNAEGCTYSGGGQYMPSGPHDSLGLSFGRGFAAYHAQISVSPNFTYQVTIACPGGTSQVDHTPYWCAGRWMDTGGGVRRFPDPGLTRIKGNSTDDSCTYGPVHYSWDLIADPSG
ncbi:MAG TPA: hypothetical protein VID47_17595 [Actinomycetota bacterium]|jgi:hypothetical protein